MELAERNQLLTDQRIFPQASAGGKKKSLPTCSSARVCVHLCHRLQRCVRTRLHGGSHCASACKCEGVSVLTFCLRVCAQKLAWSRNEPVGLHQRHMLIYERLSRLLPQTLLCFLSRPLLPGSGKKNRLDFSQDVKVKKSPVVSGTAN